MNIYGILDEAGNWVSTDKDGKPLPKPEAREDRIAKATLHFTRPHAIDGPTGRRSLKGLSLLGSLCFGRLARGGSHLSESLVEFSGLSGGSQFAGQFDEARRLGAVIGLGRGLYHGRQHITGAS